MIPGLLDRRIRVFFQEEISAMTNNQILAGHWHEVRGKIKQKWGQLTDDELRNFDGNVESLVGSIQRKTGETRASIEKYLGQLVEETSEASDEVAGRVRQGVAKAAEVGSRMAEEVGQRVRHGADQVSETAHSAYDAVGDAYAEAERHVQERPGQAVVLAFGVGVLAGVGISLFLTRSHHQTTVQRGSKVAENFGRQMLDAISHMMPQRG